MKAEDDILYYAGLFDGEGCICFQFRKKNGPRAKAPTLVLRCTVKMTVKEPLVVFQERWGGSLLSVRMKNPRFKPQWSWSVDSSKAVAFLEEMGPLLRIKKPQALLALEYAATLRPGRGALTKSEVHRRLGFRDEMTKLNRPLAGVVA